MTKFAKLFPYLAPVTLVATLLPLGTLLASPAHAADLQSLDDIDAQVAQFTGAGIGETGGARLPLDRKLRLRSCNSLLDISWYGTRGDALAVRCTEVGGWRVFVAINAVAKQSNKQLVQRRDPVRVVVGGAGFSVSRSGEAMESGKAGDWIRVRLQDNTRSGKVISARVMADGRLMVPLG